MAFGEKIALLGFGRSTIAAARYLLSQAKSVKISDLKSREDFDHKLIKELEDQGVVFEFGQQSLAFIEDSDFVMISPGIPPKASIIQDLKKAKLKTGTDVDIFSKEIKEDYIAITGTNGKTTTSSLIGHFFDTEVLANIGSPVLGFKDLPKSYFDKEISSLEETEEELISKHVTQKSKSPYILELSSFQLFYSNSLKAPKVAVHLNLTPDHLDWHKDLNEYKETKEKLFLCQTAEDFAILNHDDPQVKDMVHKLKSRLRFFSTQENLDWMQDSAYLDNGNLILSKGYEDHIIAHTSELNIVGEHNYSNALAAILAADSFGLSVELIREKLLSFEPVEHRLEFVATVDSKDIYNDSKATNPESSQKAIESFEEPILIVGGKDKNLDLENFLDLLNAKAKSVIVIGELKDKIHKGLQERGYKAVSLAKDLEDALKQALEIKGNNAIVFSPASSSFDMFKNYEIRGKEFKKIVEKLGSFVN